MSGRRQNVETEFDNSQSHREGLTLLPNMDCNQKHGPEVQDSQSHALDVEQENGSYIKNETTEKFSATNLESTKLDNKFAIYSVYSETSGESSCAHLHDEKGLADSLTESFNSKKIDVPPCGIHQIGSFSTLIEDTNNLAKACTIEDMQRKLSMQRPLSGEFISPRSPLSLSLNTPNSCCHSPNISFFIESNLLSATRDTTDTCIRISLTDTLDESLLNKVEIQTRKNIVLNSPKGSRSSPNLLPVASPFIIKKVHDVNTRQDQISAVSPVDVRSFISYGPICRICHDDDEKETLISPCRCSGSVAKVHKSCLERWLSTTVGEGKCELCGYLFSLVTKPKSFCKYLCQTEDTEVRRVLLSDFICFTILTPLIVGVSYLCILGAMQISEDFDSSWTDSNFYDFSRKGNDSVVTYVARGPIGKISFKSRIEKILKKKTRIFSSEASGLVCLATILLVIYFTWVIIAMKYQISAWRKWRNSNQEIRLARTDRRET